MRAVRDRADSARCGAIASSRRRRPRRGPTAWSARCCARARTQARCPTSRRRVPTLSSECDPLSCRRRILTDARRRRGCPRVVRILPFCASGAHVVCAASLLSADACVRSFRWARASARRNPIPDVPAVGVPGRKDRVDTARRSRATVHGRLGDLSVERDIVWTCRPIARSRIRCSSAWSRCRSRRSAPLLWAQTLCGVATAAMIAWLLRSVFATPLRGVRGGDAGQPRPDATFLRTDGDDRVAEHVRAGCESVRRRRVRPKRTRVAAGDVRRAGHRFGELARRLGAARVCA